MFNNSIDHNYIIYICFIIAKITTPLPTTTAQPTTMAATTTTECVKNNVFLDDSNVVSPSKPLSPTDIEALTEANDNKVVEIPLLSEVVIEISDLNDEINGLKVVGQNIGTIAVVYYLPESPLVPVTLEVNNLYSHLNQYLK